MAATVRLARIRAAGANAVATGRSLSTSSGSASTPARVRIAAVTGKVVQTGPVVRVAEVTANAGATAVRPAVRLAEVQAYALTSSYRWSGSSWQPATPSGVSVSRSVSSGSQGNVGGASRSKVTSRSAGSGVVSFTATLPIPVGVSLTDSGVANPVPGDAAGTVTLTTAVTTTVTGAATQGPPGAGSVTVIPDPTHEPPRMILQLTGFLGTTVTVTRIDQSGARTPVRLGNPGTLSGGQWLGFDYEAPYKTTVRYEADATLTVTSDPVVLDVDQAWLIDPGVPTQSVPLTIVEIGDETSDVAQSVQYAIGRSNPIVETDGVRHAATFDLTVKTLTANDEDAMDGILGGGGTLLLQEAVDYSDRTGYRWVAIGATTKARRTRSYDDERRLWTLPCTVTDPPSGLLQSERTWADLVAEFSTWQDVIDTYATWGDVLTDTRRDDT